MNLLPYNPSIMHGISFLTYSSTSIHSRHLPPLPMFPPPRYPLYRNITLTSLILDGATSKLSVWVDANPSSPDAAPSFVWDLSCVWHLS